VHSRTTPSEFDARAIILIDVLGRRITMRGTASGLQDATGRSAIRGVSFLVLLHLLPEEPQKRQEEIFQKKRKVPLPLEDLLPPGLTLLHLPLIRKNVAAMTTTCAQMTPANIPATVRIHNETAMTSWSVLRIGVIHRLGVRMDLLIAVMEIYAQRISVRSHRAARTFPSTALMEIPAHRTSVTHSKVVSTIPYPVRPHLIREPTQFNIITANFPKNLLSSVN
jgi:hypothetical protein